MDHKDAPGVLPKRGTPGFVSGTEEGVARGASEHVITFGPDGTARCLWTETVPLPELGWLQVHRASNIEFNNTTQHWEVKDRKGRVRFFAKTRSACLSWEQRNLEPE